MAAVNYRKICQEYYKYTDEEMLGMDVHHIDFDHNNNDPVNLKLITPEEHRDIHKSEFVLWARVGSKLGNKAFKERLKNQGPTEKERIYRQYLSEKLKLSGLHNKPHTEETKKLISSKRKENPIQGEKHPQWGRTTYKLISPTNEIFIISGGWRKWCLDRKLSPSNLRSVALGERKNHKGWKATIL